MFYIHTYYIYHIYIYTHTHVTYVYTYIPQVKSGYFPFIPGDPAVQVQPLHLFAPRHVALTAAPEAAEAESGAMEGRLAVEGSVMGKAMGKPWENQENHGKTMGKPGKPWENHGKMAVELKQICGL